MTSLASLSGGGGLSNLIEKYDLISSEDNRDSHHAHISMIDKLELLKQFLKREIRRELKIQEGADKIRRASNDRKSWSNVDKVIKKSNCKLQELQDDLAEVDRFILEHGGGGKNADSNSQTSSSDREDYCETSTPTTNDDQSNFLSQPFVDSSLKSDIVNNNSQQHTSISAPITNESNPQLLELQQCIDTLEKRINIETKVKQGVENMIETLKFKSDKSSKMLIFQAQQMYEESRTRIEYTRMQLVRVRNELQNLKQLTSANENGSTNCYHIAANHQDQLSQALELRIEELRYRLRVECAVVEGAKNAIKMLKNSSKNSNEKKAALQDAQSNMLESSQKVDIIRKALDVCRNQLPPTSPKAAQLKQELETSQLTNPPLYSPTITPSTDAEYISSFRNGPFSLPTASTQLMSFSVPFISKPAAVTGKLEVRLLGCKNLLEEIPGRSKFKDKDNSGSIDLKNFVRTKGLGRTSSKTYSIKEETSNEIMALLKLDNNTVGQTNWRNCSQEAWDQRFTFDLDRCKELEIQIYWHDWRSLCALKFLRLEEFIDNHRHGIPILLEPCGILFAEFRFFNPTIITAKPKGLKRQKLFRQKGANILRPNQMNMTVAAWGRLLKRAFPAQPSASQTASINTSITPTNVPTSTNSLPVQTDEKPENRFDLENATVDVDRTSIDSSSMFITTDRNSFNSQSSSTSAAQSARSSFEELSSIVTNANNNRSKVLDSVSVRSISRESSQEHNFVNMDPIIKEPSPEQQICKTGISNSQINLKSTLKTLSDNSTIMIGEAPTSPLNVMMSSLKISSSTSSSSTSTAEPKIQMTEDSQENNYQQLPVTNSKQLKFASSVIKFSPQPSPRSLMTKSKISLNDFDLIAVLGRGHFGKVKLKIFLKYVNHFF